MTAAGAPADLFGELYASLHGPVLTHIRRQVANPDDAEDLSQRLWTRMSEKLPEYAAREGFNGPALVYRSATNAVISHLRRGQSAKAGGRVRFESLEAGREAGAPEFVAPAADAAAGDPEARAMATVLYHYLPRRWARVLWLREAEELDYERISRILACSVSATKALLFRARQMQGQIVANGRVAGFAAAFWSFVAPADRADRRRCWPWLGAINPATGSAQFNWTTAPKRKANVVARRLAYSLERELLPPWVYLSSTCATRGCVNPWHCDTRLRAGPGQLKRVESGTRAGDLGALPAPEEFLARRRRLLRTQYEIAGLSGLPQSAVSEFELGLMTTPPVVAAMLAALHRLEEDGPPPAGPALRARRRALGLPIRRVMTETGYRDSAMYALEVHDQGSRHLREAVAAALDRLSRPE